VYTYTAKAEAKAVADTNQCIVTITAVQN